MKNNENKGIDKNNERNVQWMICYNGIWPKPWKINFINSNEKEIRKEMLEKSLNYIRDIIDLEIKRYNLLEDFQPLVERR